MSYRSFVKDLNKKREEQSVIKSLETALRKLEAKRDEYAEKAKRELKNGNKMQYSVYVGLMKNAMFNIAQTRDMIANFTIAIDLREMQALSKTFIKSLNSVMKDVYKTSKSINVASSQKLFNKALYKQNYTATELQNLLKENNLSFESSVTSLSDISDEEIRSVLESEIRKDETDMDEMLTKLEAEFAPPAPTSVKTAEADGGNGARPPIRPTICPDERIDGRCVKGAEESEKRDGRHGENVGAGKDDRVPATPSVPADKSDMGAEHSRLDGNLNVAGAAFRPQRLSDFIGQPNAVAALSDPIKKALLMGKPLPHVLLCGSFGQGKTTLAKIIANEMGANFIEVTPSVKPRDLLRVLRNLKKGDIIFIDEVHKLSSEVVEALLYPAMEDFEVHYTGGNSVRTDCKTEKISPFTLIGATTETGKLLKPFYSKFPVNVTLVEYKIETIAAIIKNSFRVNGISISDGLCFEIAKRSRLSPRTANAYVEGIASSAIVREAERRNIRGNGALDSKEAVAALNINITPEDVKGYFEMLGIDEKGLREEERKILRVLIEYYHGGPVGQENIAKALNVAVNRVDQEYEPYLVKLGLINVRPQGRYVTEAAYEYLGYKKPRSGSDKDGDPSDNAERSATGKANPAEPPKNELPAQDFKASESIANGGEAENPVKQPSFEGDELPVIECQCGEYDAAVAERLNLLLSGEGAVKSKTLDELFPDVIKDYDSGTPNRCVLKAVGREIYCDSKLERRFLCYLFGKGQITDAKAEALELEYSSGMMSGKRYFPDFALRLRDGTVAVVEMKNLSSVGYHLNIDKYEALEKFCLDNGYRYAEIAKDYSENRYISAAQLKARKVNGELKDYICGKIEQNGICSSDDLNVFGYDIKDLVCILLNDRDLKNIDRTGNNPQIISARV